MGLRRVAFSFMVTLLLLLDLALCGSDAASVETVDVHAAKRLIESDHIFLDVRTVKEFENGHVKEAINVPYVFFTSEGRVKNEEFLNQVSSVCKNDDFIVVGCLSGVRSLDAAKELMKAGFKHVKNVGGGYSSWVENGLPVMNRPHSEL